MAEDNIKQNIKQREITEEMQQAYLEYAMSVIVARALPDVRDGLKPVHRRILYSMHEMGLRPTAKYQKSAKVVGYVLGQYHPHGDTAAYDSMVRMAQDFSLRYPLVDGQGNFGCFAGDTKVALTDGRNASFEDLVREHKKGIKNYTYTFNHKTKSVEIGEIKNPKLTKKNSELLEAVLDNGEKIKCTPDHRFLLRDGNYKQAKDLSAGESLLAGYFRLSTAEDDKNSVGYKMILQPFKKTWNWVHRLADDFNISSGVDNKSNGKIRHHADFNKLNNNPDNIKRVDWAGHWRLHYEFMSTRHKTDPGYVKKLKEGRQKYWAEPASKAKAARFLSDRNKKWWENSSYRKNRVESIKKLWDNKEYKEFMREASRKNLKKLWKKESFQQLLSTLKSQELKNRWQNEGYRQRMSEVTRVMSLKLWSDEKHREHISRLQKERWLDPQYAERQSKISKELWNDPIYRSKYTPEHFRNAALSLWSKPGIRELHREKAKKQWLDPNFREVFIDGVKRRNKKRLQENPEFMKLLAQKAAISLKKNWRNPEYKERVIKSKILGYVSGLLGKHEDITEKIYQENRTNNYVPKFNKALTYFHDIKTLQK